MVFDKPVVVPVAGQEEMNGWQIENTSGEMPAGGVVTSETVPLAANCKVMVRLMTAASGPAMGMAVPTFEKLVAGGTSFST